MVGRIVDLTHVIEPTSVDAERKFVVHIHDTLEEVTGTVHPAGEWYVMSDVELMDHVAHTSKCPSTVSKTVWISLRYRLRSSLEML